MPGFQQPSAIGRWPCWKRALTSSTARCAGRRAVATEALLDVEYQVDAESARFLPRAVAREGAWFGIRPPELCWIVQQAHRAIVQTASAQFCPHVLSPVRKRILQTPSPGAATRGRKLAFAKDFSSRTPDQNASKDPEPGASPIVLRSLLAQFPADS
jgi:hypothetical protein